MFFLNLSLSHSHLGSHTHTHTHTRTHTHKHSLFLTHTHTNTHPNLHTQTHTLSFSLSLTHTHTLLYPTCHESEQQTKRPIVCPLPSFFSISCQENPFQKDWHQKTLERERERKRSPDGNKSYICCHRFRLTKRDDFFESILTNFEASFKAAEEVVEIGSRLKPHHRYEF